MEKINNSQEENESLEPIHEPEHQAVEVYVKTYDTEGKTNETSQNLADLVSPEVVASLMKEFKDRQTMGLTGQVIETKAVPVHGFVHRKTDRFQIVMEYAVDGTDSTPFGKKEIRQYEYVKYELTPDGKNILSHETVSFPPDSLDPENRRVNQEYLRDRGIPY